MQELERTINICHTAFIVFLILAIVFLAVSVIFFFWFNIRGIYDMRTGRGARKTIQKIQELNDQTGKLREDIVANTPVSLLPENRIVAPPVKETGAGKTERGYQAQDTGDMRHSRETWNSYAKGSQETALPGGEGSQETALSGGEGSQETALLGGEGSQETALLGGEGSQETALSGRDGSQETMLLGAETGRTHLADGSQETMLLRGDGLKENEALAAVKEASGYAESAEQRTERRLSYGETTVLAACQIQDNPNPARTTDLPGTFKIEKEIMWIHTEEML